jgi:hypothetical protein
VFGGSRECTAGRRHEAKEPWQPRGEACALKFLASLPMNLSAMANPAESAYPIPQIPVAPDRRKIDRVLTNLSIRILGVDGNPVYYPGTCSNLSRGGVGFETPARLDVGKVVEFEFVQVVDEPVRYWVKVLFRNEQQYGGYYVNDDGSDIRVPN